MQRRSSQFKITLEIGLPVIFTTNTYQSPEQDLIFKTHIGNSSTEADSDELTTNARYPSAFRSLALTWSNNLTKILTHTVNV